MKARSGTKRRAVWETKELALIAKLTQMIWFTKKNQKSRVSLP